MPDRLVLANPSAIICGKEQMLKGGLAQLRNAGLFKMFNLIGVDEHVGSGVPDVLAAWDEASYDAPTVEERPGAVVHDRTTLTLPLVGRLGTSLGTGDEVGGQVDRLIGFCTEPRSKGEIQRFLAISLELKSSDARCEDRSRP